MSEILTTEEAAQYLKTSPDTIKRLARAGRIPGVKFGRAWRFRKRDIEAPFDEAVADQALVAELDRRMNAASEEDFIPWEQVRAESERLP
ncbi:MAG: helix-turn-helix domain-containing protein [Armatimonadetes bacterium]|nr:helix-turn-helix domain-containing protein [Armatimonadota bacterium]